MADIAAGWVRSFRLGSFTRWALAAICIETLNPTLDLWPHAVVPSMQGLGVLQIGGFEPSVNQP